MADPQNTTILVVDDNAVKRYSVVRILRQAGYEILEASTGDEALSLAGRHPDLMVLDVKLPGISGYEVCRRIKADPELADIKILHVSAVYIDSDHRVEGLTHGADGYLVQPAEPGELVAMVKALLRLRDVEEVARRTAREWRATFDAMGNGILLMNEQGAVLRCNRAMAVILGKPVHAILGAPYQDAFAPLANTVMSAMVTDAVNSFDALSREIVLEHREYIVSVAPVRDDQGCATGAACVFTDISERKRLEEELRRQSEALAKADRAKDEFLAMLGHELRNPLAVISNRLEILRLEGANPACGAGVECPTRALLDRQMSTMTRLLDDLLDASRVTHGKIVLRREPLLLDTVVDGVMQDLGPQIEAKGLQLCFETDGQAVVSGDSVRLEQVVANLVTNAIRYTEEGTIHVRLRRDGQNAVLTVQDTGVGIRPEILPHVFDMFTRGDGEIVRAQGGLGIGLMLVRVLVELHGGRVEAESGGEGAGSTFTVTLPLLDGVPVWQEMVLSETTAPRSRRVLVVDDNADAAATLADILELWGHTVLTANDGPSALEVVQVQQPEVVLLDINLPGMSGYEVARQLREAPYREDLVVVAVTGYGGAEARERAVAAGFDIHLAKPVNLTVLKQILAGAPSGTVA